MGARGWAVEVYALHLDSLILALADKVGEVARGALALALDLDRLIPLGTEVLDALVEADAEVISREA